MSEENAVFFGNMTKQDPEEAEQSRWRQCNTQWRDSVRFRRFIIHQPFRSITRPQQTATKSCYFCEPQTSGTSAEPTKFPQPEPEGWRDMYIILNPRALQLYTPKALRSLYLQILL